MLVIRLFRVGRKNQPFFKIVVTDKRKPPRAGRFVEEVGFLNPLTKEKKLNSERIKHWLSVGAKPSDTIYNLLISEKIIEGGKISVHKKTKKLEEDKSSSRPSPSKEGSEKEEAPSAEKEKPAAEAPKVEEPKTEKSKEETPEGAK